LSSHRTWSSCGDGGTHGASVRREEQVFEGQSESRRGGVYRTKERWVPRLRCVAEQSMQMKMPSGMEAQVGFLASQSKHV
jgi:hypothetical protein